MTNDDWDERVSGDNCPLCAPRPDDSDGMQQRRDCLPAQLLEFLLQALVFRQLAQQLGGQQQPFLVKEIIGLADTSRSAFSSSTAERVGTVRMVLIAVVRPL